MFVALLSYGTAIPQSTCVKNIGVFFDPMLSFHQNVKYLTRTELFNLRNVAIIRPM